MTQNPQKIQPKFYPLQHEEWLKACTELKPAERDLYFYLKCLDPYGDGLTISVTELAKALGKNKSTISRGIKQLVSKGWLSSPAIKGV